LVGWTGNALPSGERSHNGVKKAQKFPGMASGEEALTAVRKVTLIVAGERNSFSGFLVKV